MHWEDHAWLAELLARTGRRAASVASIEELWRNVPAAGAAVDVPQTTSWEYPSRARAAARLLQATVTAVPGHPGIERLAERVMMQGQARGAPQWNTQDYGWAIPAIAQWIGAIAAGESTLRVSNAAGASTFSMHTSGRGARDTTFSIENYARRIGDSLVVSLQLTTGSASAYAVVTVREVPSERIATPDRRGLVVERWIERYADGRPIVEVAEGELVRVRLRVTAPFARDFVALEDWLPAGLEVMDPSLRTSASLAALTDAAAAHAALRTEEEAEDESSVPSPNRYWFGPFEYRELRDDKVRWFARHLSAGTHTVSYIARATTAGKFVRPPAHAEEMYNPGVNGRSEGGWFGVTSR